MLVASAETGDIAQERRVEAVTAEACSASELLPLPAPAPLAPLFRTGLQNADLERRCFPCVSFWRVLLAAGAQAGSSGHLRRVRSRAL